MIDLVIDVVNKEIGIDNGEIFTGIYSKEFPERSFSIDSKRIAFSTPQQFENRSYVVNTGIYFCFEYINCFQKSNKNIIVID